MRVIVTGSRAWTDKRAVYSALERLLRTSGPFVLVHGACPTGADAMAEEWYRLIGHDQGVMRVRYPAKWEREDGTIDKGAGFARNADMVNKGADLVLAFPLGGNGTKHTMELARAKGIEVIEHEGEFVNKPPTRPQPKGL